MAIAEVADARIGFLVHGMIFLFLLTDAGNARVRLNIGSKLPRLKRTAPNMRSICPAATISGRTIGIVHGTGNDVLIALNMEFGMNTKKNCVAVSG